MRLVFIGRKTALLLTSNGTLTNIIYHDLPQKGRSVVTAALSLKNARVYLVHAATRPLLSNEILLLPLQDTDAPFGR